jgi:hypothetical protein
MNAKSLLQLLKDQVILTSEFNDLEVTVEGESTTTRGSLTVEIMVEGIPRVFEIKAREIHPLAC